MSLSSVSSGSLLELEGSVAEGSFDAGPVAEELEEEGSESEESECSYQSLLSSKASFVSTDTIIKEMNRWFPMRCNKCETPVNGTVFVCSCNCMFCEGKEYIVDRQGPKTFPFSRLLFLVEQMTLFLPPKSVHTAISNLIRIAQYAENTRKRMISPKS